MECGKPGLSFIACYSLLGDFNFRCDGQLNRIGYALFKNTAATFCIDLLAFTDSVRRKWQYEGKKKKQITKCIIHLRQTPPKNTVFYCLLGFAFNALLSVEVYFENLSRKCTCSLWLTLPRCVSQSPWWHTTEHSGGEPFLTFRPSKKMLQ